MSVTLNFLLLPLMLGVPFTIMQKILTLNEGAQHRNSGQKIKCFHYVKLIKNTHELTSTFETFKQVFKRLGTIDRRVKAYGFLPGDLNLVKSCFNSNDKVTTFVKMQWLSFYTGGNNEWFGDTINHSEQRTKVHL